MTKRQLLEEEQKHLLKRRAKFYQLSASERHSANGLDFLEKSSKRLQEIINEIKQLTDE